MNVSKVPARRINRSRETQTKEFHQAVNVFGSTVFEKNKRDSIRTVNLPRIKIREGLENIMKKNFNFKDEVVRGWRSMKNMPNIIQSRVDIKGLTEEFSFRKRKDSCGAIWLK